MQGPNGAISSLPETLNFEHGSASSSAVIDQQPGCNDIRNPVQGRLPECFLSPNDTSLRYMDSVSLEQQDIRNWSLGTSPGATQNGISSNEVKTDHGWPSPMAVCARAGSRFEERWPEQNPLFIQDANSNATHHSINLNISGDIGNSHLVMEHSNLHKSNGLDGELVLTASSSSSFPLSSGSAESSMRGGDGQPGAPFLSLRTSCKRKGLEENSGQPSSSTSHCYSGLADNSSWPGSSSQFSRGISISTPSEHVNPSLELGARVPALNTIPDLTPVASVQTCLDLGARVPALNTIPDLTPVASVQTSRTHRNVRARTNSSSHGESPATSLLSSGSTGRHFVGSSLPWLSRSIPIDHSVNLMTGPVVGDSGAHSQNTAFLVPSLPENMQSSRANASSGTGPVALSTRTVSGDTSAVPLHQQRPRRSARNMLDHPVFVPTAELRHSNQSPMNVCSNAVNNIPANVAALPRHGSTSGANLSPSPSWVSRSNPHSQYSRRFSELVRRSLLSSLGAEPGGQNSIHTSLPLGPHAAPEEMIFPSGVVNRGLPQLNPRSVSILERQSDRVRGIPPSSRTLAAASEGRNRLVFSEHIRSLLDLMRRGQNLRFEDVVLLDQSVFYGVADIHDRHRDLRLDVDNMSYEELLALGERIGNVCTGLDEDTIFKRLKRHKYTITPGVQVEAEPCCICQEEYNDGEELGALECGHDFHTNCIRKWLMHKNLCPICKTTGLTK